MGKNELIQQVVQQLRNQHERMLMAGKSAEEYATDEESRAEDKYDTRSLEASYLAAGQAQKAEELGEAIRLLEEWEPASFEEGGRIGLGALIEADVDGELTFFLLAPAGGGAQLTYLGCDLSVVTPSSPLGQRLEGLRPGETLDEGKTTIFGVE